MTSASRAYVAKCLLVHSANPFTQDTAGKSYGVKGAMGSFKQVRKIVSTDSLPRSK